MNQRASDEKFELTGHRQPEKQTAVSTNEIKNNNKGREKEMMRCVFHQAGGGETEKDHKKFYRTVAILGRTALMKTTSSGLDCKEQT